MVESSVFFLLDKLTPLIEERVKLLTGVREEAQYIRDELQRMTAFLRVADAIEETDPEVQVWVQQVREVVYKTEDVIDLFILRLARRGFLYAVKNLKARSQIASEIQSIKSRVINIADGHQRYRLKFNFSEQGSTSVVVNNTWGDPRGNAFFLEEADLVGIDKSKQQLTRWLVEGDARLRVVSVVGIGGLGKTTLVKKVYDDAAVKQHFQIHAWIAVSESFKVELLLKDMIEQFFSEMRQPTPQGIDALNINGLKRIIKEFLQQKRYVVVFDDVWKNDLWEAIKHVLPDNKCGSRVMLTTRNADVASTCCADREGNIFPLKPLNEQESWSLFCNKVFRTNPCPQNLEEICKKILKKCEGLPLAIVTIGGVLAKKKTSRADEWELFNQSIGTELEGNNKLEMVRKLLALSYYDLPYYLKICFLYLSIFPEDHEIECMRLIRLWTAEGFVQMKQGMTIEDVAEGYLNELVDRSLIQVSKTRDDGRVRTCRVHDLLREIILSKSREQNIVAIYSQIYASLSEKVRRLSIHNIMPGDNIQVSEHISQLRSLIMFRVEDPLTRCAIVSNFVELRLLKVLDLRGASLETFPEGIVKLFHLRYLSLRETKVKVIPKSIGKLENLETLDLKNTLVTELPDGISKLRNLRHLLVHRYKSRRYEIPFHSVRGFRVNGKISGLTSLQKLCRIEANHCNDVVSEVGKLTQLRRLGIGNLRRKDGMALWSSIEKLGNLRSLSVISVEEDEIIDMQHPLSSMPRFLKTLYLRGRLEKLPNWLPSLHSLVRVHLRWSKLRDEPLQSLEDLPNLVQLCLDKAYEGEGLCFKGGRFKRLKRLILVRLEGLRWVRVEEGSMPHLEELWIQKCELVEELPSGIEHLSNLQYLSFVEMSDKLVESIDGDGRVAHIRAVWIETVSADGTEEAHCLERWRMLNGIF